MNKTMKRVESPSVEAEAAIEFNSLKQKGFKSIAREELLERLDNMIDEDGYLIPKKDIKTWQLLSSRAKIHKTTIEKVVADAGRIIKGVKKDHTNMLSEKEHIQNILNCVNKEGVIENLSKRYPSTYHKVSRLARLQKRRTESIINELIGVEDGTYKYIQKTSVFDFGHLSILGDDDTVNEKVIDAIKDCMDEHNYVVNLKKKHRSVYTIIDKLTTLNGITFEEALRIFVPEANYKNYNKLSDLNADNPEDYQTSLKRVEYAEKKLAQLLRQFDDGTGCVDLARNNKSIVMRIRNLAKKKGISINQELEDIGGFYFSAWPYEVDIYDYIRVRLHELFSLTMNASGLHEIDLPLYSKIRRLRYQCPGGAMKTVEEMINYFGYDYDGNSRRYTKFTRDYVASLLDQKYHGQKKIHNIYEDKSIGNAIFYYSGMKGMSFKEAIESFGYEYEESAGMNMFKKINLTRSEYQAYLKHKKEMEKSGDSVVLIPHHKEEKIDVDEVLNLDPRELFEDDDEPSSND